MDINTSKGTGTMKRLNNMSTTTVKSQVHVQMTAFNQHIVAAVAEIISTGYATDCVIRSRDRQFLCHCVILSMSSPFFSKLFETVSSSRLPELILPDVSSQVLQMILNIIYTGETLIPADSRTEFMEVCKLLQLKGSEEFFEETSNVFAETFISTVESIPVVSIPVVNSPIEEPFEEPDDDFMNDPMEESDSVEFNHVHVDDFDSDLLQPIFRVKHEPELAIKHVVRSEELNQEIRITQSSSPHYGKNPRVPLGPDDIENVYERLVKICRKVHTSRLKDPQKYEDGDLKGELVMHQNLLLHGKVSCLVCGRRCSIPYSQKGMTLEFKQWGVHTLKRHVEKYHKKYLRGKVGRPQNRRAIVRPS